MVCSNSKMVIYPYQHYMLVCCLFWGLFWFSFQARLKKNSSAEESTKLCTHTCMCTNTQTQTHTQNTHMCTNTHTHTHARTHARARARAWLHKHILTHSIHIPEYGYMHTKTMCTAKSKSLHRISCLVYHCTSILGHKKSVTKYEWVISFLQVLTHTGQC